MNITLILFFIALILLFAVIFMFKIIVNEKKKCRELEETIKAKNKSIAFLYLHAQELAEIKRDKEKKDEILNDAETNEEIAAVVASIVAGNNKLCNDTKK